MVEQKLQYQVKIEQFQGPLDLLFQLIVEEQLDITEISLAKVTEQFVDYLQTVEELYPEELADFLVVATKLLLIKSRAMMPYLQPPEIEDETNLAEQLKIYKEFYAAANKLEEIIKTRRFTFGRIDKFYLTAEPLFSPPAGVKAPALADFFQEVLLSLEPLVRLPKAALAKTISLREKIGLLQDNLTKQAHLSFKKIIGQARDRSEVILTFLALLELVRQQAIVVKQKNHLADIDIEKV